MTGLFVLVLTVLFLTAMDYRNLLEYDICRMEDDGNICIFPG